MTVPESYGSWQNWVKNPGLGCLGLMLFYCTTWQVRYLVTLGSADITCGWFGQPLN